MEKPDYRELSEFSDRELLELIFTGMMKIKRQVDRLDSHFQKDYEQKIINATSGEEDVEALLDEHEDTKRYVNNFLNHNN